DCIGITNEEVRQKLRGEAGTKVTVTIIRVGVEKGIEYEIIREEIPIYSVDTHFMYDNNTGYISVSRFSGTTYDELIDALDDLRIQGMEKLVLDLRGNPGGYLEQAVKISDLFIDGNKKIVYTRGRKSNFDDELYAELPSAYEKIPLIILINRGSASASEIVSGAVQDWDRGLIVGETSFGKGLVQRQYSLFDNSAFRLTISKYYTPSGRSIQRDFEKKEDYYADLRNRNEEEGENFTHTVEEDSLRPVFKTNRGRTVYGGGGITPDYLIKSDHLTEFTRELLRNNVFYQFVLNYVDNYGNTINSLYGENLKQFNNEFSFNDVDFDTFLNFVESKNVEIVEEELAKDKEYILARLKAQLARHFWKNEGWYNVLLNIDTQFKKSITLFDEAKEIADLK
ncbi:MAG: S41 family peptidase, partial [Ignavibacteria bacterium]